jgi:hypothetical protein
MGASATRGKALHGAAQNFSQDLARFPILLLFCLLSR